MELTSMTVLSAFRLRQDSSGDCGDDCANICDSCGNNEMWKNTCNSKRRVSRTFECTAIILLLSIGFSTAYSSKDIKVNAKVPKETELGGDVDMKCEWDIYGGKSLYSVKWYKDGHEFFRYIPDNHPTIQTFSQTGVKLDRTSSRENAIRLMDVTLASTGQYKCEVSTEGPAFATAFKTGNLTVISLPKGGPDITGLSSHYAVGENVTANCTAWPSIPKADLQWTINGKLVPREHTVIYPPLSPVGSAGVPNILGLRLEAEARHFVGGGGVVTIRCIAIIGSRRYEAEKHVQMAHVNNQRLSAGDLRSNGRSTACQFRIDIFNIVLIIFAAT